MNSSQKPKAILVDLIDPKTTKSDALKRLQELESLVNTFGGIVIVKVIQKRGLPDYETYIGKGKVQEIKDLAKEHKAKLVVVNNILQPKQIFNLNEIFRKVSAESWDRVDLILEIFDKHAQSTEAKLQIELSKIRHMGPRIFGMGEELSRQGGATGMRAGQGESNIEVMKRHLRRQELKILEKLKHYELMRAGHRARRRKQNYKTVALVGYTNAGKSSLLNALTNKNAYVANKLFATLDTRVGKLYLPGTAKVEDDKYVPGIEVLISDTIGLIQDLPPELIQAFKSTLSETVAADLLLHVIDACDPDIHQKIQVVEDILVQLGLKDRPRLYVFNKIDLIEYEFEELVEKKYPVHRPKGLLRAGKETSKILGWASKEKREEKLKKDPNIKYHSLKELKKKYRKYSPIFVSANEKLNLDQLIQGIAHKVTVDKSKKMSRIKDQK